MFGAQQRNAPKPIFKRYRRRRSSPPEYRRLQTGQQLFTREIDRQTHPTKFQLTLDQLIVRDARRRLCPRCDSQPFGKRDWILIVQRYRKTGVILAGTLKGKFPLIYHLGVSLFGDWQTALSAAGFDLDSIPIDRHSKFISSRNNKKLR